MEIDWTKILTVAIPVVVQAIVTLFQSRTHAATTRGAIDALASSTPAEPQLSIDQARAFFAANPNGGENEAAK